MLLLRLVPLLPFNMLNYLLSVTPVPIAPYLLASWLGMMVRTLYNNSSNGCTFLEFGKNFRFQICICSFIRCNYTLMFFLQPITLALVYVGTTLKDLSDVTHGWTGFSKTRWVRQFLVYYCYYFFKVRNFTFPWMQGFIALSLVVSGKF